MKFKKIKKKEKKKWINIGYEQKKNLSSNSLLYKEGIFRDVI